MIRRAAGERVKGRILENGCGVGMYVEKLSALGGTVIGLEYRPRARCRSTDALPAHPQRRGRIHPASFLDL